MKKLDYQLETLVANLLHRPNLAKHYQERLREGFLTRDENPESHFCVYFAAVDPKHKEVFIGHHKKANLWLFTGGHIDRGETLEEAVSREIWEEWGQRIASGDIPQPSLLTITRWMKSTSCKTHFDIWHFFPAEKERFRVDQSKISEEFHEIGWHRIEDILEKLTDPSTVTAIHHIRNAII